MKITRFGDIEAWQIGRRLSRLVYETAKKEHFARDFGLKDQICRASLSVMANIAEGFNAGSNAEFVRFLIVRSAVCF